MPERNPTAKPTVIAGTVFESGTPNTGQIPYTLGGTRTFGRFSGTAGGDVNIWVGGGRLDTVLLHPATVATIPAASGVAPIFYDSAVAVSGGPINASGHKIVGVGLPATTVSGAAIGGQVISLGIVFSSGLCVTGASGMAGFTACYTPTVSGAGL